MKANDNTYSNGQIISRQEGDVLTYYFENGDIKAQGNNINGLMEGKWIFNKKEGYLWQEGNFLNGEKYGQWTRYNADGSIQKQSKFEHNREVS